MERKIVKILAIIISMLLMFNIYILRTNKVLAMSDVVNTVDMWVVDDDEGEVKLTNTIEPILSMIRTVGIIISVISLAIIAMKIIFASVDEKAAYKQTLMPWAIGAIMVFTMTTIPSMIYNFIGEENMKGKEITTPNKSATSTLYCPIHKEELKYKKCPTEDCDITDEGAQQGYKCPSCSTRVWEYRGILKCPKCGTEYKK